MDQPLFLGVCFQLQQSIKLWSALRGATGTEANNNKTLCLTLPGSMLSYIMQLRKLLMPIGYCFEAAANPCMMDCLSGSI